MKIKQDRDLALTILRVAVGLILATHGFSKLFLGFREPLASVLAVWGFPLPSVLAWTISILELGGGVLLAAGLFRIPLAAWFILEITIGIVKVHAGSGWYTVGPGRNGVEFSVLIIASLIAVIVGGPAMGIKLGPRAKNQGR